ncbi:Transport protein particle subunit trs31 [Teratosphaeria destructans]|uniref:Trafficking protein particle complex subunit n=1 Tax=Teratosphaeria destructans TaxID=418781 RepID=A0A9W7SUP8_9PEZI|nr:Transport protein particle subunit trs31 [Teratosphaeria destructans]
MPAPTTNPTPNAVHDLPPVPPKPFIPSLRYPISKKTIYDRNLIRVQSQSSLPAFAYLFNTLITYHHAKSGSVQDIEQRLNRAGYPIGVKMLDLLLYRGISAAATAGSRTSVMGGASGAGVGASRPTRLLDLLQFIHTTLFRHLFGRSADALEQSTTKRNEYMIIDHEPVVNTYISIPKEMSQLNCAAFVAGIVEGVCDASGFAMEGVSAHWAGEGDELWPGKTIYLLRFGEGVVEREDALKAGGG